MAVTAERDSAMDSAPAYAASFRHLSDLYLLAEGGYSPVGAFLNARETQSVCKTMHLTTGEPWSIPLVFPIDEGTKDRLGSSDRVVLLDGDRPAGILRIEEIFRLDKETYAECIFRTRDEAHPGVAWLEGAGRLFDRRHRRVAGRLAGGRSRFPADLATGCLGAHRCQGMGHRGGVPDPEPDSPRP